MRRVPEAGASSVEFVLVAPLITFLVLGVLEVALTVHARAILETATEEAVRVAAAMGGDTTAGERRLRELVASELRDDAITDLHWAWTLDTLTLRVHTALPLVGPLAPAVMTTTASAYTEAWP